MSEASSGLPTLLPADVRFAPKATEVLRSREMSRRANCRLIRPQALTTVVGVEGYWIVIPAAWMTAFR